MEATQRRQFIGIHTHIVAFIGYSLYPRGNLMETFGQSETFDQWESRKLSDCQKKSTKFPLQEKCLSHFWHVTFALIVVNIKSAHSICYRIMCMLLSKHFIWKNKIKIKMEAHLN